MEGNYRLRSRRWPLGTYELFVESVEDGPRPRLFGTVLCRCDGLKIFLCRYLGLELVPDWPLNERRHLLTDASLPHYVDREKTIRGDHAALLAGAWGAPSQALGETYRQFDEAHRRMPRMPGHPYHFVTRIESASAPPGISNKGEHLGATYDIPPDAWYFQENGYPVMPFCVLLEAMLQSCGWYSSYIGFPRRSTENFFFRNLDGQHVTLHRELSPDSGTLRTRVEFTDFFQLGSMMVVSFHVESFLGEDPILSFDTSFGFFTAKAMAEQAGIGATEEEQASFSLPSRFQEDSTCAPLRFFGHCPSSRFSIAHDR